MQKLIITILSVIGVSLVGRLSSSFHGRVVSREDAVLGEIPYQVSLQRAKDNFHFCGGSILNENYILTAAHCVFRKQASLIDIIASTVDLKDPKSVHKVEKIIVHDKYNASNSWVNDIALIKVQEKFVVTEILSFVPLPSKDDVVVEESVARISGWGRLWEGGKRPNILQKTKIIIASHNYCKKAYEGTILTVDNSHICAYDPGKPTGSCTGDSGGPLVVNENLVGIVSGGMSCKSTVYPTVYTRVTEYLDWIEENSV